MINLTITGNIGADATIKQTDNNSVCNFAVACKTMKGKEAVVTWIDCAIWGKRGETLVNYLKKGTAVTVLGNLANVEAFLNKAGEPTAKLKLSVIDVALQGGRSDSEQSSAKSDNYPAQTYTPAAPYNQPDTDDLPF